MVSWERLYGAGASAFGLALGLLSYRALELDDDSGAWIAFGLSMSFCVGMWPSSREEAFALARQAIGELSMPFLLTDIPVCIGASAGILVSTGTITAGSASQLLERVDRALYTAKRAGGGRCVWSDEYAGIQRAAG